MNLTLVMLGTFGFGILGLCVSGALCLPVVLRSGLYTLLLLTGLHYFTPGGGILDTVTPSEILNIVVAVAVTGIGFFGLDRTLLEAPLGDEFNAGSMALFSCLMIVGSVDYLFF